MEEEIARVGESVIGPSVSDCMQLRTVGNNLPISSICDYSIGNMVKNSSDCKMGTGETKQIYKIKQVKEE